MNSLEKRVLGRTNVEVTRVGFGGAQIGGIHVNLDETNVQQTIGAAYEAGITYQIFRPHEPRRTNEPLPKHFTLQAVALIDPDPHVAEPVKEVHSEQTSILFEDIPAPDEPFTGGPPFEPFVGFWDWDP